MSKRVSKRKQKRLSPVETRKQMLIDRKFRQDRRALLSVLLPVLGLLAVLISYGAYSEMWRKPREPIARVNGEAVTAAHFTERVNWDRLQLINSLDNLRGMIQTSDASFLGNMAAQQRSSLVQTTVDTLIDETVIRQEAESRGITVSDRDVRNHVISNTLRTVLLAEPEPDPADEEAEPETDAEGEPATDADASDAATDTASDAATETVDDAATDTGDEAATETGDDAVSEDGATADAASGDEAEAAASEEDAAAEAEAADPGDAAADGSDPEADATSEDDAASEDDSTSADDATSEDDADTAASSDKPTDPDDVTDEDFDSAVANYLTAQFTTSGITKQDYFEIVRQAVYRERLNQALGEEIETTAPQSELDYLLFRDKATADAAAAALAGGDSWEEIVATYGPRDAEVEDAVDAEGADATTDEGAAVEEDADAITDESAAVEEDADTTTDESAAVEEDADAITDEGAAAEEDDSVADESADAETADEALASEDDAADSEAGSEVDAAATDEAPEAEATAAPTAAPTPEPDPYAFERGELRWYTRESAIARLGLSEENVDTVMALEAGASSESIQNSRGYIIVKVENVDSAHALDATELKDKRAAAVDTWLEEAKKTADIQRFAYEKLTPAEPDWFLTAYDQIAGTQSAQPTLDISSISDTQPEVQFDQAPADGAGDAGSGDTGSGDAGGEGSSAP